MPPGAVRQQAITCTNVDPDLCRHLVSLGHTELRSTTPCYRALWVTDSMGISVGNRVDPVITWFILSNILTINTPEFTHKGNVLDVFESLKSDKDQNVFFMEQNALSWYRETPVYVFVAVHWICISSMLNSLGGYNSTYNVRRKMSIQLEWAYLHYKPITWTVPAT